MGLVAIIRSWMVVILVLLLEEWGSQCHGCWEHERTALLQIKSSFNHPRPDDDNPSAWGIDADCCTWAGVGCNATTKRVVGLALGYTMEPGSGGWYLNASLFLPFKDLRRLFLTDNKILGCIENEGFEKLSKLTYLESLSLDHNEFNESILSSLYGLSSLKSLDLSYNRLKGIVHIQDLHYLTSLEGLYLAHNEIKGFKSFRELHALIQLEKLDLSGNEIAKFVAAGDNKSGSNCSVLYLGGIRRDASSVLELQSLQGFFPNLKSLHLTSYNLRGISFASDHLNNLEELNLDDSIVDDNFLQSSN